MEAERLVSPQRARIPLVAPAACCAFLTRLLLFPTSGAWPVEAGVALMTWLLLRRTGRPAWQIALVCVASCVFGRIGEPTWLPSIARVASFSAFSEGAPLTTSTAAHPTNATTSTLGFVLGGVVLLFTVLRSPAFWLGLCLAISSVWAILRFSRQPSFKALAVGCILLGTGLSALTLWSSLRRPVLNDYLARVGTTIASVPPPPLGTQPLADGLELVSTYPAGVALRHGERSSCATGEASRALPVVVRRWRERNWLLLEQGPVRLVIREASLECIWPTQSALSFDTRLPSGWLFASGVGLLLACLARAGRWADAQRWLLLGGSLSTLLPVLVSLFAFV